mmetsp:Transcript_20952/g.25425  ORF Transcript_20952/g.25425 Transcript_20952/m.25425 type:complete len:430 (-) Transcript_20952:343-1632(-)
MEKVTLPKLGDVVEVRPKNIDEIFFEAVIVEINGENKNDPVLCDPDSFTYTVLYEDGQLESNIWFSSMICPSQRKVVYSDDILIVTDGHACIYNQVFQARLLAFRESLHIVQSAIIIKPDTRKTTLICAETDLNENTEQSINFDYKLLAFEVDQALSLCLPVYALAYTKLYPEGEIVNSPRAKLVGMDNHDHCYVDAEKIKISILGAGGGSLPLALARKHPQKLEIEVVDICENVITVAKDLFGASEVSKTESMSFLHQDGLEYVKHFDKTCLDILVVDVADFSIRMDTDMELPPEEFVSEKFLSSAKEIIKPQGWIVVNVLANCKTLISLTNRFVQMFPSVYICATDPNYVFFLSLLEPKSDSIGSTVVSEQMVYDWATMFRYDLDLCHSVLEDVRRTKEHIQQDILLGWFDHKNFLELLQSGRVAVI